MKTQSLQISAPLDAQNAQDLTALLKRIPGVDFVTFPTGATRLSIDFNEDKTSGLEIENVVRQAGYTLTAAPKKAGGCCGGCGGS